MYIEIGWLVIIAIVLVALYWRVILGHPKGPLHQCECGHWHKEGDRGV